jgi:hypothetical protein
MQRENQYITDVLIRGYKYELWQLNDREPHSYGIDHGESGTLWVKQTGAGTHKEQPGEDPWVPWLESAANRDCWEITIKDGNSIKFKNTEYRIDKHTSVYILLNGQSVYEITGNDFDWCYNQSRTIIYKLKELMYKFEVNLKRTEKDRKIYYKGMPAVVDIIFSNGSVLIKADYSDVNKEYWWDQLLEPWYGDSDIEEWNQYKNDDGIVVDVLSKDIYWTRNDRSVKLKKIKRNVSEKEKSVS